MLWFFAVHWQIILHVLTQNKKNILISRCFAMWSKIFVLKKEKIRSKTGLNVFWPLKIKSLIRYFHSCQKWLRIRSDIFWFQSFLTHQAVFCCSVKQNLKDWSCLWPKQKEQVQGGVLERDMVYFCQMKSSFSVVVVFLPYPTLVMTYLSLEDLYFHTKVFSLNFCIDSMMNWMAQRPLLAGLTTPH